MKAMILAAGLGTRLLPLTREMAKPAIPFANRPLIHYCLEWLIENGIDEAVINLHHQPQSIVSAIEKRSWPIKINFSHEPNLLGTAGGVKNAEKYFKDATFVMVNGDCLFEIDLARPVAYHREMGAVATMVLQEKSSEDLIGTVRIDEEGRIIDIKEIGAAQAEGKGHTFTGIHVFEPEIFHWVPPGCFFEINEMVYPRLIKEGLGAWGFVTNAFWAEVGRHKTYLQAHRDFLIRHSFGVVSQSRLSPLVKLFPPVLIGRGCQVGEEAQIGPLAVLGPGCHIGTGAVIEDSVLWEKVTIGPDAHVKATIIGHGVGIDAGKHLEGMVTSGGEWEKIG